MRISYEWLSDFVELGDVSPKEAAEVLTRLGIEVESLTIVDLSQILIGKVLEQIPHSPGEKRYQASAWRDAFAGARPIKPDRCELGLLLR